MSTEPPVEVSTFLPLPPEDAFALVTEPARLRRWLMVAGSLDLRVGGEVHLVVAPGAHAVGRVTDIVPGRRFTYTHGWVGDDEMPPGSTSVEVDLIPEDGGTRVTIRHHGIPADHHDMREGWADFMARLERAARNAHNPEDWDDELQLSTPHAVAEASLFALLAALRRAEDMPGAPTHSTGFSVEELTAHLVENTQMVARAAGLPAPAIASGPVETRAADVLWPLLAGLEGLDPGTTIDLGAPVPIDVLVQYLSVELLVHAWDVTRATGARLDASPALVEAVADNARATRGTVFFSPEAFAQPVAIAPDADPLTRLLGLTGRRSS